MRSPLLYFPFEEEGTFLIKLTLMSGAPEYIVAGMGRMALELSVQQWGAFALAALSSSPENVQPLVAAGECGR